MTHQSAPRSSSDRSAVTLAAVLALVVAGCGPAPTPDVPPIAPETMRVAPRPEPVELPKVVLPDGFEVTLELAITPDELAQGLMFRPTLADDRGMLLIFAEERLPSIWMMNTLVALDIVFLNHAGVVVDVIPDAQPCPAEPCPRYIPKKAARAVLEIPAGSAAAHQVVAGVGLAFTRVPGFPSAD